MPSMLSNSPPINDMVVLNHAIRHDIEDIKGVDDFVTADEDDVLALVCNAGCFY